RDNGAIKVSRNLKILANKINRFIDDYSLNNNAPPTVEIIAEKFGITPEETVVAMDSSRMPLSIFGKAGDDDDGQEMIEKISLSDGEESILDRIQISKVIEGLTERERKLIVLRYYRDKTQNEIAEALGVSQVQVSRLENKILDKIRLKF
ncbi:MAG: sigma-70 family RNA polymerase sigma factor, partial [Clostridia bacterium]|nr:sigma-70 family RNA polymerase sigma factor [Clostridia bacterium]